MSDAEWAVTEPTLPVPAWKQGKGGRPAERCRRDIVDAIRYGVARMTAHKALGVLVDEGLVVIVPGVGALVARANGKTLRNAEGGPYWIAQTGWLTTNCGARRSTSHRTTSGIARPVRGGWY